MPDGQVRQVVRVNREHPFVDEAVARRRRLGLATSGSPGPETMARSSYNAGIDEGGVEMP